MSDPDCNHIFARAATTTDRLIRRLTDPPFGTETSERNLMAEAARALLEARAKGWDETQPSPRECQGLLPAAPPPKEPGPICYSDGCP